LQQLRFIKELEIRQKRVFKHTLSFFFKLCCRLRLHFSLNRFAQQNQQYKEKGNKKNEKNANFHRQHQMKKKKFLSDFND
jgi:hypothetical protein